MKDIYQLKIGLKDSQPLIWRRIQVAKEIPFADLHHIIQNAMGWENAHLYRFSFKGIRIYDFQEDLDYGANPKERDSTDTDLSEIITKVKSKFTYVYDFGDHWDHEIELEKILPEEEGKSYPLCLDGDRACPPEDCGGLWDYEYKLRILNDKDHPDHNEVMEWMGKDWDAELFDCEETNAFLQSDADQTDEFFEANNEIMEAFANHETYGINNSDAYKKFNSPEDVFDDEVNHKHMTTWLNISREEGINVEYQTFERLRNLGFDEDKVKNLILKALSIEWYSDLKYGTDHLDDRYAHNLQQLPETPQEFPRSKDALEVIDNCSFGVPFTAIEYLQNDISEETTTAILKALNNHSDHQYCWADCTNAPFFYALAAEGHICEALIDPVIQLYEENTDESDWLYDQG